MAYSWTADHPNHKIRQNQEKAVDRWSTEISDLVVIDIDVSRTDPLELCRKFREVSVAPLLLFLPTHHETQILEAYAAGVDEVVVKPISPAIFLAKIMAWGATQLESGSCRAESCKSGKAPIGSGTAVRD